MGRYNRSRSVRTSQSIYMKKRIRKNRRRAELVGYLYLLGTLALAVLACLPLFVHTLAPIGVTTFWKSFMPSNFSIETAEDLTKTINSGIYALVLLGLIINVLRSLGKLKNLTKKTATMTAGFTRNANAMDNLGHIFSGSFAVFVIGYFLIGMLCGFDASAEKVELLLLIALAVGIFIRLVAGALSTKVSNIPIKSGVCVEELRVYGRVACSIRNFLQLVAVFAMMYFLLLVNVELPFIATLLEKGGFNTLLSGEITAMLATILPAVAILCLLVLIKHATATTEYDPEGPHAYGMKNFRIFSFFVFLLMGVAAFMVALPTVDSKLKINMLIVAGIALFMFLVEVLLRRRPKELANSVREDRKSKKPQAEEEMTLNTVAQVAKFEVKRNSEKESKKKGKSKNENAEASVIAQQSMPALMGQVPMYVQPQGVAYAAQQPSAPQIFVIPTTTYPPTMPVAPTVSVAAEKVEEPEEKKETVIKLSSEKQNVHCPYCNKLLRISAGIPYHSCPTCDKIFPTRIKTRAVDSDDAEKGKKAKKAKKEKKSK